MVKLVERYLGFGSESLSLAIKQKLDEDYPNIVINQDAQLFDVTKKLQCLIYKSIINTPFRTWLNRAPIIGYAC